jgi:hypothetical protein
VGDAVGADDPRAFEVEAAPLEVGEEPDAATEEDGHEVDIDLVEKPCPQLLLGHVGSADGIVARFGIVAPRSWG